MKTVQLARSVALSAAMAAAMAAASGAPTYQYTELSTLGGSASVGAGVNASGVVVGTARQAPNGDDPPSEPIRPVKWADSTPVDLGSVQGGPYGEAFGINDAGQIVGESTLPGFSATHATLWNGGIVTDLGTLGGTASGAKAIDRRGIVVGYASTLANQRTRATIWKNGAAKALPDIGGSTTVATAIADGGYVAGYGSTKKGGAHALLWTKTGLTDLGAGFEGLSYALGVNRSGQTVGYRVAPGGFARPTTWAGTTASDLGTLGGDQGAAFAIDKRGNIVGYSSRVGTEENHATLWSGGQVIDLNDTIPADVRSAGWVLVDARAISDRGFITGQAINSMTGETRGYRLTPEVSMK